MRVKRYVADSIHEAILQVKSDLGRDALILHTKTFKVGGLFGMFAKKRFEVIAALDESAGKNQPEIPAEPAPMKVSVVPEAEKPLVMEANPQIQSIQEEMAQLREAIKEVAACLTNRPAIQSEEIVVPPPSTLWVPPSVTESPVEDGLPPIIGGAIQLKNRPTVAALVGPTGVGKTTTIAKLAAHFVLFDRAKVALITIDTYRIAAVEQLKTYAEIINLPVSVVYTPEDYQNAIDTLSDYDLILVDTAGRSQKNIGQIQDLQGFLERRPPDEVHLVISATTKPGDMKDIVERFRDVGFNRIIFSKLDETNEVSSLLGLAGKTFIPLSYITTGQNVPDDIEVVTAERLSRMTGKEFSHA